MDMLRTFGLGWWFGLCAVALIACIVGCVVEMRKDDRPW